MQFMNQAEELAKNLDSQGRKDDADVVRKLIAELRLSRSRSRRLARNKKSLMAEKENAQEDSN
jgi:hypothetical protein